ncbi:hypothetical protein KIN20_014163 [Parelaphostrongylus tenuis]|uniref:Uncharacterized protein n=1 Tax=Parelaphostrongylus tenuis TaxID=148309 RepID=A0AAD5QRM8_PARTN|nr:hypothetical protein KIN20_014163 [Parelaphostrongylus tenuis]
MNISTRKAKIPTGIFMINLLYNFNSTWMWSDARRSRRVDRIFSITNELLEKRSKLNLDPVATHLGTGIQVPAVEETQQDPRRYQQKKLLEAAQETFSPKKCRREFIYV